MGIKMRPEIEAGNMREEFPNFQSLRKTEGKKWKKCVKHEISLGMKKKKTVQLTRKNHV